MKEFLGKKEKYIEEETLKCKGIVVPLFRKIFLQNSRI